MVTGESAPLWKSSGMRTGVGMGTFLRVLWADVANSADSESELEGGLSGGVIVKRAKERERDTG